MTLLTAIREVQIPLLAAMLLGGCLTKLARVLRAASVSEVFGPTALFPAHLRRPAAAALCTVEFALGMGLIVTAGKIGAGPPAIAVRLAACVFFIVATCALIELRATRPEVGCGCFGDFSSTPIGVRALVRSGLLALAALATIGLPPIGTPASTAAAGQLLAILVVELLMFGAVSPEIGEGLIRLGYSEPCELRDVPSQRTLAVLRRSRTWRRYAALTTSQTPADIWRELCWRYVVYPSSYQGRPADLVFAVYLVQRHPPVRATLVDAATGQTLPWPATPGRGRLARLRHAHVTSPLRAGIGAAAPTTVAADIPVSTDV